MNKRQLVASVTADDLKLVAEAAEKGATIKDFKGADLKRIKSVISKIRKVQGAQ